MTYQQVYDKVVLHLAEQGHKSRGGNGTGCAYRGANGAKCAIGVLISNRSYSVNMEDKPVFRVLKHLPKWMSKGNMPLFLERLQLAHDQSDSANQLKSKLVEIGIEYGLMRRSVDKITSWK